LRRFSSPKNVFGFTLRFCAILSSRQQGIRSVAIRLKRSRRHLGTRWFHRALAKQIAAGTVGAMFDNIEKFNSKIERGSLLLPSPKSDGALFVFLGLIGLLVFAYIIGKRVAHFLRRSQIRFYPVYRHQ
jgi:hypothetical protein